MLPVVMPDEAIIYDRNGLYAEVWAEPMRTVAARYGVSDVALAKTCRRLGVPVPGRGYWAKQRAGKATERPPLPPHAEGEPERIVGARWEPRPQPEPLPGLDAAEPLELLAQVVVPAALDHPHRLVAVSARYLRKARPVNAVVSAPRRSCLDLTVSPDCLERALRIVDALLKAMEAAGLEVEVAAVGEAPKAPRSTYGYEQQESEPSPPERVTRVRCDEEWIQFSLTESVRRTQDKGPPAPDGGAPRWEPREYDYESTGVLALELTNVSAPGVRTRWKESKHQPLEQLLGHFVAYLPTVALSFKLEREAEAQRQAAARQTELRRLEEQQRRWEEESRRREEEKREHAFEAEVARWRRAQDIREYVRAALASLEKRGLPAEEKQAELDRLSWALKYADRIDPLED